MCLTCSSVAALTQQQTAHQPCHVQPYELHPQHGQQEVITPDEPSAKTEERGCSPITVLEGRGKGGPGSPGQDSSGQGSPGRGSSHTVTTTTSWGAPLSTTTNIQICDQDDSKCLHLTLMSESHLTLHPGHVLQHLAQQEAQHTNQSTDGYQEGEQQLQDSKMIEDTGAAEDLIESEKTVLQKQEIKALTEVEECEEQPKEACDSECHPLEISGEEPTSNINTDVHDSTDKEGTVSDGVHRRLSPNDSDSNKVFTVTQEVNRLGEMLINSAQSTLMEEQSTRVGEYSQVPLKDRIEGERSEPQLVEEGTAPLCDTRVSLSKDDTVAAVEVTASSAHRPTTLMITSNSNESSDDTECTTNDPTRDGGEHDTADSLKGRFAVKEQEQEPQHVAAAEGVTVPGERHLSSEGGAIPRPERPTRPAPRTTTLVKVKVEKRPIGSHRSGHEHQVVKAPSVEEEVRGLMQEVKEATSQIKQEVKELRQADTPTPDTPTPLREFKEFLNREEEQEQERLPTITETCRENEDDTAPPSMGGEHCPPTLCLHLSQAVGEQEPSLLSQVTGDESNHPDSGYSTLEGRYARPVESPSAVKYAPSCSEMVPEGYFDDPNIKCELESPSSYVDLSELYPVGSVDSAPLPSSEKQGRSKFKSFLKKVRKLTSKSSSKSPCRTTESQGEYQVERDIMKQVEQDNYAAIHVVGDSESNGEIAVLEKIEGTPPPSQELAKRESSKKKRKKRLKKQKSRIEEEGDFVNNLGDIGNTNDLSVDVSREGERVDCQPSLSSSPSSSPTIHTQNVEIEFVKTSQVVTPNAEMSAEDTFKPETQLTDLQFIEDSPTESSLTDMQETKTLPSDNSLLEVRTLKTLFTSALSSERSTIESLSTESSNSDASVIEVVALETSVMEATAIEPFDILIQPTETIDTEVITCTELSASETLSSVPYTTEIMSSDTCTTQILSSDSCTTEILSSDSCTTETLSSDSCTTEILSSDPCTTETLFSDPYTTEVMSSDISATEIPSSTTETLSSDPYSIEVLSSDTCITEVLSSDTCITEALPLDTCITEALPLDTCNTEALPLDTCNTEVLPLDTCVTVTHMESSITEVLLPEASDKDTMLKESSLMEIFLTETLGDNIISKEEENESECSLIQKGTVDLMCGTSVNNEEYVVKDVMDAIPVEEIEDEKPDMEEIAPFTVPVSCEMLISETELAGLKFSDHLTVDLRGISVRDSTTTSTEVLGPEQDNSEVTSNTTISKHFKKSIKGEHEILDDSFGFEVPKKSSTQPSCSLLQQSPYSLFEAYEVTPPSNDLDQDEDDYIELPDTGLVEILETVMEVDESDMDETEEERKQVMSVIGEEEEDDENEDDDDDGVTLYQQEIDDKLLESDRKSNIDVEKMWMSEMERERDEFNSSDDSCTPLITEDNQEEEIQLLSDTDIKAMSTTTAITEVVSPASILTDSETSVEREKISIGEIAVKKMQASVKSKRLKAICQEFIKSGKSKIETDARTSVIPIEEVVRFGHQSKPHLAEHHEAYQQHEPTTNESLRTEVEEEALHQSVLKIQPCAAVDSDNENSFPEDFPITVPDTEESDTWLKTIREYQSLTAAKVSDVNNKDLTTLGRDDDDEEEGDDDVFEEVMTQDIHERETEGDIKVNEENLSVNKEDWVMDVMRGLKEIHGFGEMPSLAKSPTQQETDPVTTESNTVLSDEDTKQEIQEEEVIDYRNLPQGETYLSESQEHTSHLVDDTSQSIETTSGLDIGQEDIQIHKIPVTVSENIVELSIVDNLEATSEQVTDHSSNIVEETSDALKQNLPHIVDEETALNCETLPIEKSDICSLEESCEILQQEDDDAQQEFKFSGPVTSIDNEILELNGREDQRLESVLQEPVDVDIDNEIQVSSENQVQYEPVRNDDECMNETSERLDRVAEELKAMILTLEHSLVVGQSQAIGVTPIMYRLNQMEQEVANLCTDSSIPPVSVSVCNIDGSNTISDQQCLPSTSPEAPQVHGKQVDLQVDQLIKMPVGVGTEATSLLVPKGVTSTGEVNGEDIQDATTDVEDLYSEGDQSPMIKRKPLLVPPEQSGGLTDTEDMDLSGDEEDIIQEKKNLPSIEELGLLPEPVREMVNLTEGFARGASPLLPSGESDDNEEKGYDVIGRHKKSLQKLEQHRQLVLPTEDVPETLTDTEDMMASGDEEETGDVEDSLPDHYLDQSKDVANKSKMRSAPKTPKIRLIKDDESTDDEQTSQSKYKSGLAVEAKDIDKTTDVEDMVLSDRSEGKQEVQIAKSETKVKRKKVIKRKTMPKKPVATAPSKSLSAPNTGNNEDVTDVEILTGDEEQLQDDDYELSGPDEDLGPLTDSEDVAASDVEEADDLVGQPINKVEPAILPQPLRERIKISEVEEENLKKDSDDEDKRPKLCRKHTIVHEPIDTDEEQDALDVGEGDEGGALTDAEDMDMDEQEEKEMVDEMINRIPEETEIYTIKELDESIGSISKTEKIIFTDAELVKKIKEAEASGLTIQEALAASEDITDVEDLDEVGSHKSKSSKTGRAKKAKETVDSDDDSDTDPRKKSKEPRKKSGRRGARKLPLVPQLSEVRSIPTKAGPLSIIITEEDAENPTIEILNDEGVNVIAEVDEKDEDKTDVEEMSGEEAEIEEMCPADIDRPRSPLPPHLKYSVLESPKRELVHIKEDKYGVPQVTIRKLKKDELGVSDIEDGGVTDTEDIDVSEEEALRLAGVTEDSTAEYELPDSGPVEVSSKVSQVTPSEEVDDDTPDEEEILLIKKSGRKAKGDSRLTVMLQEEDSHTDVEILSDQEGKIRLNVRGPTPGAHTDVEDLEGSDNEIDDVPRDDAPTPDIIRDAAIMKTIVYKEGPQGTTYTEEARVAPKKTGLLNVEAETGGTTDVEDLEASGAEDDEPEYPPVELPNEEYCSVDISERTSAPAGKNESKQVKDNLLLAEDNLNSTTDVESLGEGEGNRCASNCDVASSQPLTVDTSSELPCPFSSPTHPKLCIHPGLSLENDPYCGELTQPLVVEAQLEQVYYHAPQGEPEGTEVELEAHNGCVVRRRQVVASLCQAREVRRFWSSDRNSPLQQIDIGDLASPAPNRKGFKTILYLEQPNLLDTISISDTLCDPNCFTDDRMLDFDSSSIDSCDDRLTFRDSDIITIVDRLNQEARSSIDDDLPSPHLSSICGSVNESLHSNHSFTSESHAMQFVGNSSDLAGGAEPHELGERLEKVKDSTLKTGAGLSSRVRECEVRGAWGESIGSPVSASWCSSSSDSGTPVQSMSSYSTDLNLTEVLISDHELSDDILFETDGGTLTRGCSRRGNFFPSSSDVGLSPAPSRDLAGVHYGCQTDSLPASDSSSPNEPECGTTNSAKTISDDCDRGNYSDCLHTCTESPRFDVSGTDKLESCESEWDGCDIAQKASIDLPISTSTGELSSTEGNTETVFMTGKYIESAGDWNLEQQSSQCVFDISGKQNYIPDIFTNSPHLQSSDRLSETCLDVHVQETKESIEQPVQISDNSSTYEEVMELGTTYCKPERPDQMYVPLIESSGSSKEPAFHTAPSALVLEDCVIHVHQALGSSSSLYSNKETNDINESVSVLKEEEDRSGLIDTHKYPYHDDFSPTPINVSSGPHICSVLPPDKETRESAERLLTDVEVKVVGNENTSVPLSWRHTLPRSLKQAKQHKVKLISTKTLSSDRKYQEIAKEFVGVKGLIDQWEEIVEEEKRRSLPASPAIGRRILPPFAENNQPLKSNNEMDCIKSDEKKIRNITLDASLKDWNKSEDVTLLTNLEGCKKSGEVDGNIKLEELEATGRDDSQCNVARGNVVEQVASVGDIIQQFEGWFGMGEKQSTRGHTWPRLYRRAPSPSPRSPIHPRRVATVKPLREPQPQEEKTNAVQEEQMLQQQLIVEQLHIDQQQLEESFVNMMESLTVDGFVPRVMESLTIPKSSSKGVLQGLVNTSAGVLYPEGELHLIFVLLERNAG
ncbi:hypothetical protein Pmani_029705 [Petrolisthes manimaculis]|uniref:Uncharacterized protein n=1 Tax=Petrolisthes manimaculis TaxID=1843537 RepID=A0AAE1NY81_9EUCA|nr:hypothetical protein Pmani_029705 [Petrolisthes manimaculis]